ncbi:MAG: hypothetical protein JW806_10340 [Sedimentisphaerales bacterium]|nr:hypothetical protein [Sedimentisphaerales bacterium]
MAKKPKPKMPHALHEIHLCYLANLDYQTQKPKQYKSLVADPRYVCKQCGRVAADKRNLCKPVKL